MNNKYLEKLAGTLAEMVNDTLYKHHDEAMAINDPLDAYEHALDRHNQKIDHENYWERLDREHDNHHVINALRRSMAIDEKLEKNDRVHAKEILRTGGLNVPVNSDLARRVIEGMHGRPIYHNGAHTAQALGALGTAAGGFVAGATLGKKYGGELGMFGGMLAGGLAGAVGGYKGLGHLVSGWKERRDNEISELEDKDTQAVFDRIQNHLATKYEPN